MNLSKIGKILLGLIIAALGLYIFLKDVNINNLKVELRSIRISALIFGCILAILTLYLRAIRWRLILPDTPGTTKKHLFSTVVIGFMINNILPARIGEVARAFILWRKNKFPAVICIGTLILERIIDLLVFMIFFIVPVFILPQCSSLRIFALILSAIVLVCIAGMIFYVRYNAVTVRLGKWIVSKAPAKFRIKLTQIGGGLVSNLGWLHSPKRIIMVLLFSFLTTLCYPLTIILLAGKTDISFGLIEGMFAQAFAAFGAAIPLAPGYVGTLHAIMLQGLSILGMNTDHARALVIVYHIINYIPITVLGLILFFSMNLSFKEIADAKDIIEQEK